MSSGTNSGMDSTAPVTLLTTQQIETLQQQIRQFKNLGKRFSESKIPKMIETIQNLNSAQNAKPNGNVVKEVAKETPQSMVSTAPQSAPPAPPAASSAPTLSWQCFNSLLFCGPNKFPQEGAISFSSSVRTYSVHELRHHSPLTLAPSTHLSFVCRTLAAS